MISLITLSLLIFTIFLSNYLFKSWFNHLNLYGLGWALFIILYELRLIRFVDVQTDTWIIILLAYISILLGTLTFFVSKRSLNKSDEIPSPVLYISEDTIKYIKYLVLFFSIIGLLAALQNWFILLEKYGSVAKILLKANTIYRDRIAGEAVTGIPYLFIASNIGIFFAAIYTAYKRRITFIAILPFAGVILKGIASVGRGGIFVAFLQFGITLVLFYSFLKRTNKSTYKLNFKSLLSILLVVVLGISSMAIIKGIRGSFEDFKGTSRSLKSFDGVFISPQIYLYFSSNIGVLSKYFERDEEDLRIGENTFLPIYNLISKFGVIEDPKIYPRGYFIPMWTNSATYLRDLHSDFGYIGLFLGPYLLGFLSSYFRSKFESTGSLVYFVATTYIYIIISFSVFYMISRAASWMLGFLFLLYITPKIQNFIIKKRFNASKL